MCHEKEDLMTTRKTDKYANGKIPESILPPRFVHAVSLTCLILLCTTLVSKIDSIVINIYL